MIKSIIVEGPDGVGKTTIAAGLSKELGYPVFKCPSEKEIFFKGGRDSLTFDYTLTHFLKQTGFKFISDRAYPSEYVYSEVFGRDTDFELIKKIDRAHAELGTTILYLYSSIQPIEPDDIVPSNKYFDILRCYDSFMSQTNCRVVRYDTSRSLILGGDDRKKFDTDLCLEMLY